MTGSRHWCPRSAVLAAGLLAFGLVACSDPPPPSDCLEHSTAEPDPSARTVVVLNSISPDDHSPRIHKDREKAFKEVLKDGFKSEPHPFLLGGVIGHTLTEHDVEITANLVPEGPNKTVRKANQRCKERRLQSVFADMQRRQSSGGPDIFSVLKSLDDDLAGLPRRQGVDVVLLSTMFNGATPLNLENPAVLDVDPWDLFDELQNHRLVPNCQGWRVHVIGAGRTAGTQTDTVRATKLREFWAAYFAGCGGQLVAYENELLRFPVRDRMIDPPRRRERPLEIKRTSVTVEVPIPNHVLFDYDKDTLRPEADADLNNVLNAARQFSNPVARVVGHTDVTGSPTHNQDLSDRRAAAVKQWLIDHGFPSERVSSEGKGSSEPVGNAGDPADRARSRRVVVSIIATT